MLPVLILAAAHAADAPTPGEVAAVPDWFGPYAYRERHGWNTATDVLLYGTMGAAILPSSFSARTPLIDTAGGAATLGVTLLATEVLKLGVGRPRPYVQTGQCTGSGDVLACHLYGSWVDVPATEAHASFPSGHTAAVTAAGAIWTTRAALDPDVPRWVPLVGGIATVGLGAVTGIGRVEAGKHHWSDVALGFVIGGGIGTLGGLATHTVANALVPADE